MGKLKKLAGALGVDPHEHPGLDLEVAGEDLVDGGAGLGRLDLDQVAQLADVDAEHRRPRRRHEGDRAQDGAGVALQGQPMRRRRGLLQLGQGAELQHQQDGERHHDGGKADPPHAGARQVLRGHRHRAGVYTAAAPDHSAGNASRRGILRLFTPATWRLSQPRNRLGEP